MKKVKGLRRKLLRSLVVLTVSAFGLIGFWFILRVVLNTEHPILPVSSSDMCTVQPCNCLWNPFAPTLHRGDVVIVHGIDPKEIRVGDIIVFHKPKLSESSPDELIVHRVYASEPNPNNGNIYFETKGDAAFGPAPFDYDYRGENYTWNDKISEHLIVGKVVLRIPWVGHVALFVGNSYGVLLIVALIIILVIVEFVVPAFRGKGAEAKQEKRGKDF